MDPAVEIIRAQVANGLDNEGDRPIGERWGSLGNSIKRVVGGLKGMRLLSCRIIFGRVWANEQLGFWGMDGY